MGFFAKQIDGRIDDPSAGWKARGLWVTSGNRTPVHIEGLDAPVRGAPTLRRNQAHSWWTSSCGPIRWRTKERSRRSAVVPGARRPNGFSKGFDTQDLKEARDLLGTLPPSKCS